MLDVPALAVPPVWCLRRSSCCGAIFCENCSRHRCLVQEPVTPPGKDPLDPTRPHRVCNACYADVQASQVLLFVDSSVVVVVVVLSLLLLLV